MDASKLEPTSLNFGWPTFIPACRKIIFLTTFEPTSPIALTCTHHVCHGIRFTQDGRRADPPEVRNAKRRMHRHTQTAGRSPVQPFSGEIRQVTHATTYRMRTEAPGPMIPTHAHSPPKHMLTDNPQSARRGASRIPTAPTPHRLTPRRPSSPTTLQPHTPQAHTRQPPSTTNAGGPRNHGPAGVAHPEGRHTLGIQRIQKKNVEYSRRNATGIAGPPSTCHQTLPEPRQSSARPQDHSVQIAQTGQMNHTAHTTSGTHRACRASRTRPAGPVRPISRPESSPAPRRQPRHAGGHAGTPCSVIAAFAGALWRRHH